MSILNDFPKAPDNPEITIEYLRQLANAINLASEGKLNANGEITLDANSTTTTLTNELISANSVIHLTPTTANAAAVAGSLYPSSQIKGEATLTHANDSNTDKTFKFSILG